MHRLAVPQRMRTQGALSQIGVAGAAGIFSQDVADSMPRKFSPGAVPEQRAVVMEGAAVLFQESSHEPGSLRKQRAETLSAALAGHANKRWTRQLEVARLHVQPFLDPCSGVVEKHQQDIVPFPCRGGTVDPVEETLDLLPIEIARRGPQGPLERYCQNPMA